MRREWWSGTWQWGQPCAAVAAEDMCHSASCGEVGWSPRVTKQKVLSWSGDVIIGHCLFSFCTYIPNSAL